MFKNSFPTMVLVSTIVVSGVSLVSISLACTKDCITFDSVVANLDPPNLEGGVGTYCLLFNDSNRGGFVYNDEGGTDAVENGEGDYAAIGDVTDCSSSPCVLYNPRVVDEPMQFNQISSKNVIRYDCADVYED